MDLSSLFLGLVPLLVFIVLDGMGNVRYAVIGTVFAAILELLYSHFWLGGIDAFSLVFAALILVFAALSYRFNNPIFFKFKPVVIGLVTALVLLATSAISQPALLTMADRYTEILPGNMRALLADATVRQLLARTNLFLGFALVLHAAATAWAALNLSRWWWFAISGPGLYIVVIFTGLIAQL
ncbi:MAG: septation protein IspZ [Candidatus Latescibacterota bacterium]|jgi:intracellular septation protein A